MHHGEEEDGDIDDATSFEHPPADIAQAEEERESTVITDFIPDSRDQSRWARMTDYLFVGHSLTRTSFITRLLEYDDQGGRDNALTFSAAREVPTRLVFLDIYIHTHPLLLSSLVWRNLAKDKEAEPTIKKELRRIRDLVDSGFPGIYYQQLVNAKGDSPTPEQFLEVAQVAKDYAQVTSALDQKVTGRINSCIDALYPTSRNQWSAFPTSPPKDWRRYYWQEKRDKTDKRPPACSEERARKSKDFVSALKDRIRSMKVSLHKTPFAVPLCEVGWSVDPLTRLRSHERHSRSNYIMNLFEAICGVLYPGSHYRMAQEVIYLVYRPEQAFAAEIFFKRACQGYIDRGSGFSHHGAGTNNDIARPIHWYDLEYRVHQNRMLWSRAALEESREEQHLALAHIISTLRELRPQQDGQQRRAQYSVLTTAQACDEMEAYVADRTAEIHQMEQVNRSLEKFIDVFEELRGLARQYEEILGPEVMATVQSKVDNFREQFEKASVDTELQSKEQQTPSTHRRSDGSRRVGGMTAPTVSF